MCLKFFIVKSFEIAESSLGNTCLLPARCTTACPWMLPTLQNSSDFWSLNSVIFLAEENLNFLCSASLIKLPKTFRSFIQMAGARFGSFFRMTREIELLGVEAYSPNQLLPTFHTRVAQKNQKWWLYCCLFVHSRNVAWARA